MYVATLYYIWESLLMVPQELAKKQKNCPVGNTVRADFPS